MPLGVVLATGLVMFGMDRDAAIVGVALASTLTALAGAYLLGRRILQPLGRLRATSARLAGGELSARSSDLGPRELRELGTAFNDMAASLERLFDARASEQVALDQMPKRFQSVSGRALRIEPRVVRDEAGVAVELLLTISDVTELDAASRDVETTRALLAIARQKPAWTPGTRHGYHTMTLGLYMQELIRRVDPAHRTLGRFFRDEIAGPLGLDFYIGLPVAITAERIATVAPLSRRFSRSSSACRSARTTRQASSRSPNSAR